jgi:anaerobic magnesium-protoporphyrin IX monomethyl ester cyclase
MKVILTNSYARIRGTIAQPLSLAYLAASAEKFGHKIKIIDALVMNYSFDDIKKEIKHFDPDVIGATSWTENIYDILKIIKIAKEINPNCMTVLGGPHPTAMAKETLETSPYVDVIVRGEGEKTFVKLLEKKEKLSTVEGISFRSNGRIIENKDGKLIEDMDSLPFPAYHLLPMEKYVIKYKLFDYERVGNLGDRYCIISTCRGCPYNCIFCGSRALWGKNWRVRSPENVIEEIKILNQKYKVKVLDFMDDTSTIDKKRMLKICELIKKEKIDILWTAGTTRVDLFDKEIARSFKDAGCKIVRIAPESGNQKSLDFLQKGFTIEDVKRAAKIAKDAGLATDGNYIIGIPGENRKAINQTILFAKKLDLTRTTFSILAPFPGTKLYEIAKQKNLLLTEDWSRYSPIKSVLSLNDFSAKELEKLLIKATFICSWFNPKKTPSMLMKDLVQLLNFKKHYFNIL